MATYHICDLCGKDLKDEPTYFIAVGPSISVKTLFNEDINEVRKSCFFERVEPHSNKEVCKECASAYAGHLDEVEKHRDTHKKIINVVLPDTPDGSNDTTVAFCLGDYND